MVACSGGADSLALATLLASKPLRDHWNTVLGHVDHRLRKNSGEREHLEAWAARFELPLFTEQVGVEASLAERPGNLEARARELRYKALERMADEAGADFVLTGHTADDQAESLWLWLLRGTGIAGLAPIARRRPLREGGGIQLLRPLLGMRHDELCDYLRSEKVDWLEDPSNRDTALLRNRIRHELLPFLDENFGGDPVPASSRLASQVSELVEFLDGEIRGGRGLEVLRQGPWQILDRDTIRTAPRALTGWQLVGLLKETGPVRSDWIGAILDAAQSDESGQSFDIGGGRRAVVSPEAVYLGPESEKPPEPEGLPLCRLPDEGLPLELRENPDLGRWKLHIREIDHRPDNPKSLLQAIFDTEGLRRPLRLVNPWPGMRIRLHGSPGRKKISDLLIDRKLPRPWRRNVIVLVDAKDQPLWVPGLGRSRHALVTSGTKSSLSLDMERSSS